MVSFLYFSPRGLFQAVECMLRNFKRMLHAVALIGRQSVRSDC